jgi:glycosyltransferase involved in cell wall biosynthesis
LEGEISKGFNGKISNMDLKVEIIIPTLNEEPTIGSMLKGIRSSSLPLQISILVVDGGSVDHTVDICKRENVKLIIQKGKGKGSAMREAVEHSEADIIVFIDGDGTYAFSDLELLLEPLISGKYDMVIGSRILGKRGGAIGVFNSLGNKIFNRTINFAMKSSFTDSLSGYRSLYRKTFDDLILFSDSFDIEVEMTVEALAKGYRVLEVPIKYGRRKTGALTKLDPVGDGLKIGRTLLFILMNVNPLKFFGIISLGFFLAGSYPATQVLYEKISTGQVTSMPSVVFSSLLFVTGTISMVVGLVSELVVRSRRRLEHLLNKKFKGTIT